MSFLDELRARASALREQNTQQSQDLGTRVRRVQTACQTVWTYFEELVRQLNVIEPNGPVFSVDGKTAWPPMRLHEFQFDARKKNLRDEEVFDHLAIHWRASPRHGKALPQSVKANFPPDLERVRRRLSIGAIAHERVDIRHPESNALLAYEFRYATETLGAVKVLPAHDEDELRFQLLNLEGFDLVEIRYPADAVQRGLLDELAKRVMGQPHRFV